MVVAAAMILVGCQAPIRSAPEGAIGASIGAPIGTEALLKRHHLSGARAGFLLFDLNNGDRVSARNENEAFIPASTAKVPTTVAALNILGPGYRFQTRLLVNGELKDGVLSGDLYLKGGGDPLLSPQDLMGLAGQLGDVGISRISGRFYFDTSFLKSIRQIEPNQPDDARYNPGLGALSLDFNQILNRQAGGQDNEYLPVHKPGLRAAQVFRMMARLVGVELPEPTAAITPNDARVLARINSAALVDIVRLALQHSNNMVAELIGQVAARKIGGRALDLTESSAVLNNWLKDRLVATSWDGFHLPNHSGLTSKARVTPSQMASIIRFAAHQRFGGWRYLSLLPVSGFRESFRSRFRGPAAELRVWAKTGTLKYAKGITGIMFTNSDRNLAFALYVTDFKKRKAYDEPGAAKTPGIESLAEKWIGRAEAFEEDLIREWIAGF
ncbi:MAG: D-alanyl-D-alanine carboxypeptidase [Rhodospirillales bacterium]|nr:D-alanyl-D-alanine carboxypeptidase [Rhodospirillales bacterium]